jgi:hypothetical protein
LVVELFSGWAIAKAQELAPDLSGQLTVLVSRIRGSLDDLADEVRQFGMASKKVDSNFQKGWIMTRREPL